MPEIQWAKLWWCLPCDLVEVLVRLRVKSGVPIFLLFAVVSTFVWGLPAENTKFIEPLLA